MLENNKRLIWKAMRHWEDNTCLRFRHRTTEKDYINYYSDSDDEWVYNRLWLILFYPSVYQLLFLCWPTRLWTARCFPGSIERCRCICALYSSGKYSITRSHGLSIISHTRCSSWTNPSGQIDSWSDNWYECLQWTFSLVCQQVSVWRYYNNLISHTRCSSRQYTTYELRLGRNWPRQGSRSCIPCFLTWSRFVSMQDTIYWIDTSGTSCPLHGFV